MIKITKILFVQTIIFLLFFTGQGFTKSLPPGSGEGDIPANILILLDKSGSMSARSASKTGVRTQRPGRLAVGSTRVNGGNNVLYNSNYSFYDKRNISYDDKLIWKWRQSSPCTYRSQAKVSEFYDGYFYFVGNNGQLCKIHQTTQKTHLIKTYSTRNFRISGGDLHGKYLYIFSNKWRDAKIIIRDLSNNQEKICSYSYKYEKLGDFLTNFYVYYHGDFEINHAGTYMVGYRYDWKKNKRGFYKFNITVGLNCPGESHSEFIPHDLNSYGVIRDMESSTMYNDYFYAANYSQSKVTRYDLSDKTLDSKDIVDIGKKGKLDASYSPSSRSEVRFKNPISIAPGVNTIYVSDFNNNAIQIFGEASDGLDWENQVGGKTVLTRMQGAHAAIKSITSDGSLTSGVHFGFAYWSYSSSVWVYWRSATQYPSCISIKTQLMNKYGVSKNHWWFSTWGKYRCRDLGGSFGYTGWDTAKKQGKPCNNNACLKVKVDKDGATRTAIEVLKVSPGGGTDAKQFTKIALDYFKHPTDSPRDSSLSCQVNYIIVIGDGAWSNHSSAIKDIKNLKNSYNVKTITIAYGGGINSWGLKNFREAARAGGTPDVIVANDPAKLKALLSAEINRIKAEKVSFTAPAITATVEEGGSLMQAQFKYVQNQEWQGSLKKLKLNSKGEIAKDSNGKEKAEWEAHKIIPNPKDRKIWSVLEGGASYKTDYNNMVTSNASDISDMFTLFGTDIQDYHSQTPNVIGTIGTSRCKNAKLFGPTTSVQDKVDDDTEGLITFIRGLDYFDYDGDCNLTEIRKNSSGEKNYLGDIYHSEMIVVAKPNAETNFTSDKEESFHRAANDYTEKFAENDKIKNRDPMVYVGANDGMLHAFNYDTGIEEWAFIPPFILPRMPFVMNTNLNQNNPNKGGSNAIYGVDGSPVQHDVYMKAPGAKKKDWHTILVIPYGRGGKGLTALIVTDPKKPVHLFSVYNDTINHKVYHMRHDGNVKEYEYIASAYNLLSTEEAILTEDLYDDGSDPTLDGTCNDTKKTSCYKSKTYTWENFPANGLTNADFSVEINGKEDKNFTVTNTSNTLSITFGKEIVYQANTNMSPNTDSVGIFVKQSSAALGVQGADAIFDYSQLGETWSAPRILRIPNKGPGDTLIDDDITVAVMGAGYGAKYSGVGSGVYVINLEDEVNPGKIEKFISIDDNNLDNQIVNSVPGDPVVITADNAKGYVNYRGAIVYVSDLEGKITKINLTDLVEPGLNLYDHFTLFDTRATKALGRYMFHSMDTAIGKETKKLWLFAGTGDYINLNDTSSKITKNLLLGIKDPTFPYFTKPPKIANPPPGQFVGNSPTTLWDLTKCISTTKDSTGVKCPDKLPPGQKKLGWYIELDKYRKVTASPTVAGGIVYFPIFTPTPAGDKCKSGAATICAVDDECGTNVSKLLGKHAKDDDCHYVGTGILSRVVTYGGKIFANIAGESESKKDLISKDAIGMEVDITRGTWKENF